MLEAMAAMTVLAVLLAIALPNVGSGSGENLLKKGTQDVMYMVDFARTQAQVRNRAYELTVVGQTIRINESGSTRCSGFAGGVQNVKTMTFQVAGTDYGEVKIVANLPAMNPYSLCFKPDGRVLQTATAAPIATTSTVYGAGEATIVIQRTNATGTPINTAHQIVVPYNGLPVFRAGPPP